MDQVVPVLSQEAPPCERAGRCIIDECNKYRSYIRTDRKIRFFRFPLKCPKIVKKWCKSLNFLPEDLISRVRSGRVCSLHFSNEDYQEKVLTVNNQRKSGVLMRVKAVPRPVVYYREARKSETFDTSDVFHSGEALQLLRLTSTPIRPTGQNGEDSGQNAEDTEDAEENVDGTQESGTTSPLTTRVNQVITGLMRLMAQSDYEQGSKYLASGEYSKAYKCWKAAAKLGLRGALFNLGVMYEHGIGADKNLHRALHCYSRATFLGHKKAMHNLGIFHLRGYCGLTKNIQYGLSLIKTSGIKHYVKFRRRAN